MRILVVGAGAVGGYFGGRLLEKGEDVTFLVREERQKQLDKEGLVIQSVHGDLRVNPRSIVSGESAEEFDVVIVSTKAYQLKPAIESFKQYVGEKTMILPLLNGMAHMDELEASFNKENIIGGLCFVESTLDMKSRVIQTSPIHDLLFGERNGEKTERILRLQKAFEGTKANIRLSENINQDMWHKYLFIATLSGVTSLFRSPIGPIRHEKQGAETIKMVLGEASTIMRSINAPIADHIEAVQLEKINAMGYGMKSSLQRDMEKKQQVEADHFFGFY